MKVGILASGLLRAMPKKPSKYDEFFDRLAGAAGEADRYRCKQCSWERNIRAGTSRSSFKWHLITQHSDVEPVKHFLFECDGMTPLPPPAQKRARRSLDRPADGFKPELKEARNSILSNSQSFEDYVANLLPPKSGEEEGESSASSEQLNLGDFASLVDGADEETERIEDAIMTMVVTDALPISTVENPGFRRLLSVLAPNFKPKSREDFERVVLPRLFRKRQAKDES